MIRVGIDEAGRGPLAGPVRVGAAVILDETIDTTPFDDSKKLTEKRREIAYDLIKQYETEGKLLVTSSYSRASTIDRLGIIRAQAQAMRRSIQKIFYHSCPALQQPFVEDTTFGVPDDQGSLGLIEDSASPWSRDLVASAEGHCEILIDGNHTFGLEKISPPVKNTAPGQGRGSLQGGGSRGYSVQTIIGGDGLIPEISIASIIAKVERDRHMSRQAKQFPQYGFEKHKGYGTAHHRKMIQCHGWGSIHRESFCKRFA